jgi:hypothetical protein
MSSNRSLVLSAVSAAIIAIVLVSGVVALGVLNTTQSTVVTSPSSAVYSGSQSNSPTQPAQVSSSTQTATSTEVPVSSPSSSPPASGGTNDLAVLMTDPPTVPDGVTAVFITYANLGIHISLAGNNSGWHVLDLTGQINLMSIINSTQTIVEANVTSGNFNALAFNVTSAIVTFQGVNHTADLVYQNHVLYVPIVGGINVTQGQTSAAVIDISPTVLLLGNETNPTFAFLPAAIAYTIPAQSVSTLHLKTGDRDDIQNASWWVSIQKASKFEITGVSLTPTSLSFNVTNTGNAPVMLRIADLASRNSISGGKVPLSNFASLLTISEVFVLEHNSTVVPITMVGNGIVESLIDSAGYLLPVGQSVTFTYSGNITLGVAESSVLHHPPIQPITATQTYILSLAGNGQIAQVAVMAKS